VITPPGWVRGVVGDVVIAAQYGTSTATSTTGTRPVVSMRNLNNGKVSLEDLKCVEEEAQDWTNLVLHKGDVLLNRTNSPDLVGKVGIVQEDSPAVFASYLVRLVPDLDLVVPEFLTYWLNSTMVQGNMRALATRGVSQANINPTTFRQQCPFLRPPVPEQHKIAKILRTWDDAIQRLGDVHRAKSAQLGRLRKAIFDPACGLAIDWGTSRLQTISERITAKSEGELHPVMTISAKVGFVLQSSKYSRDMAGASLINYTLLQRGEFAYNKGNSLTYPQGCVYQLEQDSALVPNVYFSFRLNEGLNSGFFAQYFAAGGLNRQLAHRISSGVRGNGLLNLSPADFFDVEIPIPDLATQDSVAELLGTASLELAHIEAEVALLINQKNGLMDKLLTGEVRVHVEADRHK
jgi:type I restriction enzyme S subunit